MDPSNEAEPEQENIKRSTSEYGVDDRLTYSEGDSAADDDDDESEADMDSDSEFLVHPILRSLIKSKSAYAMRPSTEDDSWRVDDDDEGTRRMRTSRTAFEMSLSKMMESTEKSLREETEQSIRIFIPKLDAKWPEPDEPRKSKQIEENRADEKDEESEEDNENSERYRRTSGSWSAPPSLFEAPCPDSMEYDPSTECWSAPETAYEREDGLSEEEEETAASNSEEDEEFNLQRSSNARRRTVEQLEAEDASEEEEESSEEVWPSDLIMRREKPAWLSNGQPAVPRTFSVQFNVLDEFNNRRNYVIRPSHSAHASLLEEREEILGEETTAASGSELNEQERRDVLKRYDWLERGSQTEIREQQQQQAAITKYPPYTLYDEDDQQQQLAGMSRSNTGEELGNGQRARRKLPRRPDEEHNEFSARRDQLHIALGPQNSQPRLCDPTPCPLPAQACCIETPISPRVFCQSPLGSAGGGGRRLPALPHLLNRPSIPLMSHLPPTSVHKSQNPTQLCFFDGLTDSVMDRSGIEDSYYEEEDGINGNGAERKPRAYFSPENSSGISSCTTSGSQAATHRTVNTFLPRHNDELMLEIGDAVHVERTSDDLWSYGTNLRTGRAGIFPSCVVCEIDFIDEICTGTLAANNKKVLETTRDTFYLTMLASIEVAHHKGNDVLLQAMNKVLSMCRNREETIVPQTVLVEISFRGIHVIDKKKKDFFQCPSFDFFYSLQNISFCGAHPKQLRYFAFISKHPLLPRFACHVFMSNQTTQPIVESIGRAFKRSYDEYMAFAHPTEDIYLE